MTSTLSERFDDYSSESQIYSAMDFIDPRCWTEDIDCGNDEILFLCEHFCIPLEHSGFDKTRVISEWKKFRIHVKTNLSKLLLNEKIRDIWRSTFMYSCDRFPNLLKLVSLILSISGSNSNVERTFSTVTNILSDKRLSMNHDTLDNSVVILGNDTIWSNSERDQIIERARQIYMKKRRSVQVLADEEDEDEESPGSPTVVTSDDDLDSEDDAIADELAED